MATETALQRNVPGARSALALLLAINLFNYIDRYVLAAVVPKIKAEFFAEGDSNAQLKLGMLATAFLISYMLAAPVFGWLADRMSRWAIVGAGVIVWSLASGGSGLAATYLVLLVTRLFVGIGEAAYGPAAPTLIADMFPVERRGRVMALFYMAIPVGSALGYVYGGVVASLWDWRWAFYLSVPPGLLLGCLCFVMREPQRGAADRGATKRVMRLRDYKMFWKTPSYVYTSLGMAAMTFAVGGIAFWMPEYIHSYRGEPDLGAVNFRFGAITAVAGLLATLAGGLMGDWLRTRWSGSYFLVSGIGMVLALPLFMLTLYVPFPYAWGLIFLTEFCLFFNTGPTNTILANVLHPSIRSSGYAMNILVIHVLGDAISPPMIGKITSLAGGNMNAGFMAVSFAILLSGILWIMGAKHLQRDTLAAPTMLPASSPEA